jgi:hypothetical protein
MADLKKKLAILLYRSMLRSTREMNFSDLSVDPKVPRRQFHPLSAPAIAPEFVSNSDELQHFIRIVFRKEVIDEELDAKLEEATDIARELEAEVATLKFSRMGDDIHTK